MILTGAISRSPAILYPPSAPERTSTRTVKCRNSRAGLKPRPGVCHTVLRINTWELYLVLPKGATALNPPFSNIDIVPWVDSFPKA